jgi:hypothetical protein
MLPNFGTPGFAASQPYNPLNVSNPLRGIIDQQYAPIQGILDMSNPLRGIIDQQYEPIRSIINRNYLPY